MSNRSISLTILSTGLAIIYGLGTFIYMPAYIASFFNPEILSFPVFQGRFQDISVFRQYALIWVVCLPQFIGFIGVLLRKEWGRRIIVFMSIVICALCSVRVYQSGGTETLVTISIFIYIALVLFLLRPEISDEFSSQIIFNGKKVLVVDDDRVFLKIIRAFLISKGYMVYTALTGEKGVKITKTRKPDLILLDVILPRIKGREVCARLKQDPATRDIPVIFLTAKDSPDDVQAEMELGASAHLTKPINYQSLIEELHNVFEG